MRRSGVKHRGLSCAVLLVLVAASIARADDMHYNDFPAGNRALGLGGAYTAIANDPSGLFYNPGGLIGITRANLSVSTSLYGLETTSSTSSLAALRHVDLSHLELNVIPGEVGATYALGDIKPGEPARIVLGFDVLVPSSRTTTYHLQQTQPDSSLDDTRTLHDETLLAGVGGAYLVTSKLSVGAALFYQHRTVLLNERTTAKSTDGGYANEITTLNVFDDCGFGILGAHYQLNDKWSFGATWISPSFHLRSGGTAEVTRVQWNGSSNPAPSSQDLVADTSLDSKAFTVDTSSNGGFRLGAAYTSGKTFELSADLSGYFPISYQRLSFKDPELEQGITLPVQITRRMTVNGALGGEWRFSEHFSVAGGFFTDFSSAPSLHPDANGVLGPTGRDALPRDDLFGGSIAVGYFSDHSLTRVGFTMISGSGQNVQYQALQNSWVVQNLSETLMYVFIASTFRY